MWLAIVPFGLLSCAGAYETGLVITPLSDDVLRSNSKNDVVVMATSNLHECGHQFSPNLIPSMGWIDDQMSELNFSLCVIDPYLPVAERDAIVDDDERINLGIN